MFGKCKLLFINAKINRCNRHLNIIVLFHCFITSLTGHLFQKKNSGKKNRKEAIVAKSIFQRINIMEQNVGAPSTSSFIDSSGLQEENKLLRDENEKLKDKVKGLEEELRMAIGEFNFICYL